jgi:peroxiredoxin
MKSVMHRYLTPILITALAGCATSSDTKPESSPTASSAKAADSTPSAAAANLPDFTLETTEGGQFTLSDHVGKEVIVLSFWATWCKPCLAELPHLDLLYQAEKENGLTIVAISMDEPTSQAEVAPTASRLGLTMPVLLDTEQLAVSLYNRSRNAPMTVVIDKQGKVVRASAGYNPGDEEKLAVEVRTLLAQ